MVSAEQKWRPSYKNIAIVQPPTHSDIEGFIIVMVQAFECSYHILRRQAEATNIDHYQQLFQISLKE